MFSFIVSVVMFLATLPMKAVEMGYKTYKVVSKFNTNNKKDSNNIIKKLAGDRSEFSKGASKDNSDSAKAKKSIKNITKFALKSIKYIISILRTASVLIASIDLIVTMFVVIAVVILIASISGSVMLMTSEDGKAFAMGGTAIIGDSSAGSGQSTGTTGEFNGTAIEALNTMGQWYVDNIRNYGNIKFDCELVGTQVRADCTGLACAVVWYILGDSSKVPLNGSGNMLYGSEWGTNLCNYGFEMLDTTNMTVEDLKPGDLLIGDGHAEFYVSPETKFGWGSVKKAYPVKGTFYKNGNYFGDSSHDNYSVVYRYVGGN